MDAKRCWAWLLWGLLVGSQSVRAQPESDLLALQNVTIIDLRAGELRRDQTVLWERSRIVAAGPAASIQVPQTARIIAGRGRFLLPGLWDMHVHLRLDESGQEPQEGILPSLIAHGVTAVRDMADENYPNSTVPLKRRWDAEARAGVRVGPRIVGAASIIIDGPAAQSADRLQPAFLGAGTPADARKLVRAFADESSVDFIKVYSRIPRDSYFAMMDEARRVGMPVAGHKPLRVSYIEAADAGQKSMEHAREILLDSFAGAGELQRNPADRNLPPARLQEILEAHDPAMLQAIFAAMVRNGTYYVPTHITRLFDWKAAAHDREYLEDPRLRLLPARWQVATHEDVARTQARAAAPGDADIFRAFFEKGLEVTRLAHEAGVKVMVGTDAGDSYCFHGSSLHDEMAWMVKAGLSPLAVLRAATVVPAEYVGRSADFGAIEAGKLADMVLLEKNPLARIDNARSIQAVVFNGRLFDRAALDVMLAPPKDDVRSDAGVTPR